MKTTKDITAIVMDFGLYVELARKLSKDFKKVYYYNFWQRDYPCSNNTEIGSGFPEIEKIDFFWDKFDEIDLWIFPNVYSGDLQVFLESQGKLVWGSREGEAMELYRWDFIEFQKKIGMDCPECCCVKGTTELRKSLYKDDKPKFVKMDATERGDNETFGYKNEIECEINDLRPMELRLGMKSESKMFIVQDHIPTKAEIGYDGFTIDGEFPTTALFGIEAKDIGYVGMVRDYKDLPEGVTKVNSQLKAALKKYGYRGNISTEIREGEDGKHYLIDLTCRNPYPPSNLMMEIWENMAECIYEGAQGNLVDMKFSDKFGLEIELFSDTAATDYFTLFYPDELKQWIKQPYITYMNDRTWVIPQENGNTNVGSLVCIGNSFEEIVKLAQERAEMISGHHLKIDLNCLNDAIEELKKL